jgi:thiol-disulfide isomerase/thioredoxin
MSRYRMALISLVGVVAAAFLLTVVLRPSPTTATMTGSAALIPSDERQPAPNFTGLDGWINSPPLTVPQLHGKVVLVDFWTFSCVNCVRTLPHLAHLRQAYGSRGLVVVGVHSPEFDFEKVPANVQAAVTRLGVTWPVALDSEMNTWNAYGNQYWPAEYLVDQSGRVAYIHDGEGDDSVTESAIAALLNVAPTGATPAPPTPEPGVQTPELYAGSERGQLADGEGYGTPGQATTYPDTGPPRAVDLIHVTGSWADQGQYLVSRSAGHIRLRFIAGNVFLVAGADGAGSLSLHVSVDGNPVPGSAAGSDLVGSVLAVGQMRLYNVLTGQGGVSRHLIDITVPSGLRLYTFTFG